jgi:hypothetical protein
MVRASAGSVATGTVNGFEVVAVGPSDSEGDWLQVDSDNWDAAIGEGSFSAEVHDTNGKQGTVEGLYCRYGWCNYGSNIDWDNQTVKNFDGSDISFTGDRIAIVGEGGTLPNGWDTVDELGSLKANAQIISDVPDSLCSGDTTQVEVGITQEAGLDSISGTVELKNNITGQTTTESFSITPDAGTKRAFTLEIPRDTVRFDGVPATVRLESNADNSPQQIDIDISVGAGPDQVEIGELKIPTPGKKCVGERIEPTVEVINNSDCDAPINAVLANTASDNLQAEAETVSGNSTTELSFRDEVPQSAKPGSTFTYIVDISFGDTLIDTQETEVSVGSASFNFISATGPTTVCTGKEFTIEAQTVNNGDCEGRARYKISNSDTGFETTAETDSVRVGSDLSLRLDRTLPDSVSSLDKTTYTVEFQEYNGEEFKTVSSKSVEMEVSSASISLNRVEVPSSVCPGQSYNITSKHSNEGDCEGRVRIQAIDVESGETSNSSPEGLRVNSTSESTFTFEAPTSTSVEESGNFDVQVAAQVPSTDGGWETIEQTTKTISIGKRTVSLSNFSSPSNVCVGNDFNVSATANNSGSCPVDVRAKLVNAERGTSKTTDVSTVSPGNSSEFVLTESISVDLVDESQVNLELSLQYRSSGGFTEFDSTSLSVVPSTFDLSFSNVSVPDSVCAGREADVSFDIENTQRCPTTATVVAVNSSNGSQVTIGEYEIQGNSSMSQTGKLSVPVELVSQDEVAYTLRLLGSRGGSDVEEASTTVTVGVNSSELSASNISYPSHQKPGERSNTFKVENVGDCSTTAIVTAGDQEFSSEIRPGGSASFTHEYFVGTSGASFSITVEDDVLEEQVATKDVSVSAHKYASLDIADGTLKIVGGFDSDTPYRGTISGSDIEGADDLEDRDTVLVPGSSGTFNGTLGTSADDTDTLTFSTLQYLNVAVINPVVWVVNGEIKDESPSFRYNTLASQALNIGDRLALDHSPEVKVNGKVRYNYGALRRKLGVSSVPPSIRVVRRLSR